MSLERLVDDLARTLAQPMPRRRALRLLGGSLVAATVSGLAPGQLGAAPSRSVARRAGSVTCQNVTGTELWTCPTRKYLTCGTRQGECIDHCKGPGHLPCGSGEGFDCCIDPFGRDGFLACRNGTCVPTCKAIQQTTTEKLTACGEECCFPNEECKSGKCVRRCAPGTQRCGSRCCRRGETCRNGKCCPSSRVCGPTCCPAGTKCTFSNGKRFCCPSDRVVTRARAGETYRFCCPPGTVQVSGGSVLLGGQACCAPQDRRTCCRARPSDEDDLAPLVGPRLREFCVDDRTRRL
ncbi:MAG: hypothetical protein M5U27_05520 [Gaiella sp.]|nr:hypothetical protein [Gaiella sp.]